MAKTPLKIIGVQLDRPSEGDKAAGGPRSWLDVTVEVENTGSASLFVWASHTGYDYALNEKTLTVHLAEKALVLPPGIRMISDHPRLPAQVEAAAQSRVKVRVRFPALVRRAAPGGRGWIEEPIGDVEHVAIRMQAARTPVEPVKPHENPADIRARLLAHGDIVHATLPPTSGAKASSAEEN